VSVHLQREKVFRSDGDEHGSRAVAIVDQYALAFMSQWIFPASDELFRRYPVLILSHTPHIGCIVWKEMKKTSRVCVVSCALQSRV
jgi:hypothetical protein